MELLTEKDFLKLFPQTTKMSFKEFMKIARVKTATKIVPLTEYIENKKTTYNDLPHLYNAIVEREEYLTRFYNTSLRIDDGKIHLSGSGILPMKSNEFNNNERVVYKNVIRNLHWKDILQNTKSGLENVPTFLDVLTNLYKHTLIDYKLLTPSALYYIKNGRIGSVFSSYYFRASIMNPFLVYSLNKSLLKGTRIFTPTLGWTSYCYGFLEDPNVVEYVGTDVISSVCSKTRSFARALSPPSYLHKEKRNVEIYCRPSESFLTDKVFMKEKEGRFDVVFFSPPYYELEIYSGGKQSTAVYKTYDEWLRKYWEATIQLSYHVLQKGGRLCYILSGYGSLPVSSSSSSTRLQYDLLEDMNGITKKYFKLKQIQNMYNKNVNSTSHRKAEEKIMIFIKK